MSVITEAVETMKQARSEIVFLRSQRDALLAACEAALYSIESYPPSRSAIDSAIGKLRAAIAQARGKP